VSSSPFAGLVCRTHAHWRQQAGSSISSTQCLEQSLAQALMMRVLLLFVWRQEINLCRHLRLHASQ
jgi:hypothetical protein